MSAQTKELHLRHPRLEHSGNKRVRILRAASHGLTNIRSFVRLRRRRRRISIFCTPQLAVLHLRPAAHNPLGGQSDVYTSSIKQSLSLQLSSQQVEPKSSRPSTQLSQCPSTGAWLSHGSSQPPSSPLSSSPLFRARVPTTLVMRRPVAVPSLSGKAKAEIKMMVLFRPSSPH